ncbi:hypothetical protein C2845_PM07G10030 [Panicum miliaceum]|uniref:Uncharacterized protein n=1 Tax=Panicum miliaceum TaxID=4540 RepID=A0A3L6SP88_PANMI|nr:hypothetical protein C2845_PM07G10030 [Panicum miliaceum]
MNAMVDSITDAVESAIHRGNQAGGLRRFMLQGAISRVIRDITIHPRRSNNIRTGGSGGRRSLTPRLEPRPSSRPPTHGPAMLSRRARTMPEMPPLPSSILPPSTSRLPPPPPLSAFAVPWNEGGLHGWTPSHPSSPQQWHRSRVASGFAYDLDVVLQPAPPMPRAFSYANVAANRLQTSHRSTLPPANALGAGKDGIRLAGRPPWPVPGLWCRVAMRGEKGKEGKGAQQRHTAAATAGGGVCRRRPADWRRRRRRLKDGAVRVPQHQPSPF